MIQCRKNPAGIIFHIWICEKTATEIKQFTLFCIVCFVCMQSKAKQKTKTKQKGKNKQNKRMTNKNNAKKQK